MGFNTIYKFVILLFATGLGTGYIPIASGSISTLVIGIPLYILVSGFKIGWYLLFLLFFILISIYLCEAGDRVLGEKDSHKVVIDEYCGYLTAMTTIPITLTSVAAGFFIFRLFDILKVQPGRWAERNLPGGVGVVMDDVVAGIYTNIVLNLGLFAFRKGIF